MTDVNEVIRALMRAEPFRPYVIRTRDGGEYEVESPENCGCSVDGSRIVVFSGGAMHILDARSVTAIGEA
jgi:hypothetical protein